MSVYKIPVVGIPVNRDPMQTLCPEVGLHEVEVLASVHGGRCLKDQAQPLDEFTEIYSDDENANGKQTVGMEWDRLTRLYGANPENNVLHVERVFRDPDSFEQRLAAIASGTTKKKKGV